MDEERASACFFVFCFLIKNYNAEVLNLTLPQCHSGIASFDSPWPAPHALHPSDVWRAE